MTDSQFPATAGPYHGELRLADDGITFVPVTTRDGEQMCLGVSGWQLSWDEVSDLERVGIRRGLDTTQPGGDVRIHYRRFARFVQVALHTPLREFFDAADVYLHAPGRAVA